MNISVEHIIEMVTREVIRELKSLGFTVNGSAQTEVVQGNIHPPLELDMSAYKTPLLSEERLKRIHPQVRVIIIPANTIFTPGARDWIRKNRLKIIYTS